MSITGLIDKTFRPHKGAVYRIGLAMPEPEYETATGRRLFTVAQMEQIAALAIDAEREECAKACENQTEGFAATSTWDEAALSCARAIRMRSNY